jgi:hypothetical protein
MQNESHDFDFIKKEDVDLIKEDVEGIYAAAKAIPGTKSCHSFISLPDGKMEPRVYTLAVPVNSCQTTRSTLS